jgi:DnaK suppressor protein
MSVSALAVGSPCIAFPEILPSLPCLFVSGSVEPLFSCPVVLLSKALLLCHVLISDSVTERARLASNLVRYLTVIIMATKISNSSKDMEKRKLDNFRKRLEERQQALRKAVSRTEEDGRIADQDSAQDIADRAANSYTKEFLFSVSNNDRQLLNMVEQALQRIREGSFGECVSCGNEINSKRLEAVPWTRYCIACQEKKEKGLLEEAVE